ncbi:hypothetical protein MK632_26565 [Rhizobium changzhiense]|uniref:Glutamyl-tRNA reductase N-terminal domain-containing protein n=1 Tax=Rhizobium changzhiense TaxID=2692317 RepID=A0A7Z0RNU9_9HYPH|nr:hypothetical protein [Rhizobium changzhiense]MCH4549283.1 hypothetical protein [Rhizobium changzhiense]NZD63580.1 hypothetical protein [Rhizobium changzhiense]
MTDIVGHYVDHEMTSPFQMAQHSAKIKPMAIDLAKRGILLITTCLRVEVYGEESSLGNIDLLFSGFPRALVKGARAVAKRLAEISSGAKSQILGEPYVSDQVSNAVALLDPALPISRIARLALGVGRASRERLHFIAPFNYDRIVYDLIAEQFKGIGEPGRLYMIGAGMLGRDLISTTVADRFRSTVVVTRNPKKLRRRLRGSSNKGIAIMRPEEIGGVPEPQSCVVIATADLSDEYKAVLRGALLRLEPRTIVDLSSIPVLSKCAVPKLNYVTMYDQDFLGLVGLNNQHLASKLPLLLSDIEKTLPTAEVF